MQMHKFPIIVCLHFFFSLCGVINLVVSLLVFMRKSIIESENDILAQRYTHITWYTHKTENKTKKRLFSCFIDFSTFEINTLAECAFSAAWCYLFSFAYWPCRYIANKNTIRWKNFHKLTSHFSSWKMFKFTRQPGICARNNARIGWKMWIISAKAAATTTKSGNPMKTKTRKTNKNAAREKRMWKHTIHTHTCEQIISSVALFSIHLLMILYVINIIP